MELRLFSKKLEEVMLKLEKQIYRLVLKVAAMLKIKKG